MSKNDRIHVFNRDLCRSLPLEFEREIIDDNGIPGYRFVPPANVFGTPQENPENACFCNNPDGICDTPSGVFNVSACQFGSPVMLSWPHFFQASPKLLKDVEGLSPNKEKHQFSIDVQPVSGRLHKFSNLSIFNISLQKVGNGLSGRIRSQINIKMSKIDDVKQAEGLRDILLPVVWFSDDLEKITDGNLIQRIN